MRLSQNRRGFLAGVSAWGAAGILDSPFTRAEEPPETAIVRFVDFPDAGCIAPQYIAEKLLRAEGFADFRYVPVDKTGIGAGLLAVDMADFTLDFASAVVVAADNGTKIKALSGVHVGCWELFAHEGINRVLDLKGKRVGIGPGLGTDPHLYVTAMAAYVGLDPTRDIDWVTSDITPIELFAEKKIDAVLGVAQEVQAIRARKLGHVVVSGILDRPWSQYFCCILAGRADYVQRYPIATKRVLRALLKGADICVSNPQLVARQLIADKRVTNYDYTANMLAEIPYAKWREFEPEDTLTFLALRLREAGVINSSPRDIIANGTDWRFLNELRRELKT